MYYQGQCPAGLSRRLVSRSRLVVAPRVSKMAHSILVDPWQGYASSFDFRQGYGFSPIGNCLLATEIHAWRRVPVARI
jgi:hypothetical protein